MISRRPTEGAEPDAVKVARPVLNGGREETCGNATRLAPTQLPRCGFQQQVSASVRPCGREGNPRHRRRNATLPSGIGHDRAPPRQRRSKTAHLQDKNLQDRRGSRQRRSAPQDVADRAPPPPPGHAGPTHALASRPLGARAGATAGQGRARYPERGRTLMRTPVVKRQTFPKSGFFQFFSAMLQAKRNPPLATCSVFISVCWCTNVTAPNTY